MLGRKLSERKRAMTDSALYIIYFGIVTRILTFVKEIFMASKIGAGSDMDSYLLALGAIMVLTTIISEGVIIAVIPLLREIQEKEGKERRLDYTNNLINTTIVISGILLILSYFLAPIIVKIYGPGFTGKELNRAIELFRLGLPMVTLTWIRSIGGGFLQADHAFRAGAKGGVANATVYIIYLVFFSDRFGIEGLMVVGTLAVVSQIYIVLKAMKAKDYKYKWKLDFKDKYLIKFPIYLLPILLSIGINEVNLAVDNAIASTQSSGSIAELNYANQVIQLFIGLFISAIITVTFPILTEDYNKEKNKSSGEFELINKNFSDVLNLILNIAIPVSLILIIMAEPIIKIFFERGAFDEVASILTSQSLAYYAIGLGGMAIIPLISRGYYAIYDMKTPIAIAGIALAFNIGLDLLLVQYMGVRGLALGTSISVITSSLYALYDLNTVLRFTRVRPVKKMFLQYFISGLLMGGSILLLNRGLSQLMRPCLLNNLLIVIISSIIGIVVYSKVYKTLEGKF